jgi:ATP-dependent helicase/nuclease subunit A
MPDSLVDEEARRTIREDTDRTLFVDAGAGSGKTSKLIDRVMRLVLSDGVPLRSIAAVTFTEKAGAELRDRLRLELEKVEQSPETVERGERASVALDDLDAAPIGTLHSFAQRILTEHPIEAGLPPLVEVLDEVASSVAFEERWTAQRARLLDDDSLAETFLLAMSVDVTLEHLRELAKAFGNDWDLVSDRVLSSPAPEPVALPDLTALIDETTRLVARSESCSIPEDRFLPRLVEFGKWRDRLAAAQDVGQRLQVLVDAANLSFAHGQGKNWSYQLTELRSECAVVKERARTIVQDMLDSVLRTLAHWIAARVLEAANDRKAEGRLEFHDLLVLARDLLRRDPDVRAALQQRYRRLLLDEFQDTDPIQIELAVRIAGGAAASQEHWEDVDVPPGALFVVGDPKQSIYRFRRADIATYLRAQQRIGETVKLTTNFRTVAPVLAWVNAVFRMLIQYAEGAQPAYLALDEYRADQMTGDPVTVLGARAHDDGPNAATLREREAADVAAVIQRIGAEDWQVWDERTRRPRSSRLGDIAVLVPARTSLPFLEGALDRAGVSYRAEASSLVYQGAEVRDLFAAARAIADPTDALSLVTALRSPLFGCGDDDLWTWKQAGGRFSLIAPVDGALADHPVGRAMAYLLKLHRRARWMTPSQVLGALIADRRMMEVAASGPRARDAWRRLRFVVDQARAWAEVEHGGLRAYLAWAARQADDTSRVAESVLPETDTDAVRVMTVHAAKGLEFPIVILSGMSSQTRTNNGVQLLWGRDSYEVKISSKVQTYGFVTAIPLDEQMDAYERIRLLYVATTRARDHLVVSLHRKQNNGSPTNAKLLAEAGAADTRFAEPFAGSPVEVPPTAPAVDSAPPQWQAWLDHHQSAMASSRTPAALSASGLEGTEPEVILEPSEASAGRAKGQRDVELPPWSKGRYGNAIGRAVHGALQVVDLATGDGLDAAVAAQCLAEGVTDYRGVVGDLVRSALASDVVRRAATRQHWRESYVGTVREEGDVLEGFVDLIYREDDDSLVVVDYKTDAVPAAAITARTLYYRPQIEAYLNVLSRACGTTTISGRLLFLHPAAATEVAVGIG